MENIPFYKSLYDRELKRRVDIDNAINVPIGTITLLFTLIYFLFDKIKTLPLCWPVVLYILTGISAILTFISVFFLAKSYNNFFTGFSYLNFPLTNDLRKYQDELIKENTNGQEQFLNYLTQKFVDYTDNQTQINDRRAIDLYRAKSFIIAALVVILSTVTIFLTLNF